MTAIRTYASKNRTVFLKTGSYFCLHILVAATVAYWLTQSWATALLISGIEPLAQMVAYFFHEKAWAPTSASLNPQNA